MAEARFNLDRAGGSVITTFPARVLTSTLSLYEALWGLILAAGLFLLSNFNV
jgi:hypothetical protein